MKILVQYISLFLLFAFSSVHAADINQFFGHYKGQVNISEAENRNLEVTIKQIDKGFNVSWKTITQDQQGSGKTKSYSIDFVDSNRSGIYGSAMKTNLFGGQEALDPIKGEPYFWARINAATLTIFGMLITEDGSYEIQRYDRTLKGKDMLLEYTLSSEGELKKSINAKLTKE